METQWSIRSTDSKLYAFIVAILPCVMMYKVPFIEKGVATVLVLLCAIIFIINIHAVDIQFIRMFLPGIIYLTYIIIRCKGDLIEIVLQISAFIHLYAIFSNIMNLEVLKKCIKAISTFAAICVITQNIFHNFFGTHIPMIIPNFCLDEMNGYYYRILYGIGEGIYRPSAFFLEPAHMARYLMLGLVFCLLDKQKNYVKAALISIGMIATTSSMGLVILLCVWGWYYFEKVNSNSAGKLRIIFIGAIAGASIIGIALCIPGVQRIVARVFGSFGSESSDYNAIHGRLFWWDQYLSDLKGYDLIFGKGATAIPDVYFTGFMELLYGYGIVGVSLYYIMLVHLLRKSNNASSSCILLLIGGLMFFANLTGYLHTIVNLGIVLACLGKSDDKLSSSNMNINSFSYKYIR